MKTGCILIVGSANPNCDVAKLARALDFVRHVTVAILNAGNGVSVLATNEPTRAKDDASLPTAFDWEVLRTVDRYIQSQPGGNAGRVLVRAATGADSETKRFSEQNNQLIRRLQEKNALEIHPIPEDIYVGGSLRDCQVDMSDGMVAIGGGKGTYITGDMMLAAGKPVMPMDIRIGARREDGEGALKLLSEMKSAPKLFLPRRHEIVKTRLFALSLEGKCPPVERIANEVADILKSELEGAAVDNDYNEDAESENGGKGRFRTLMGKIPFATQIAANLTLIAKNAWELVRNMTPFSMFVAS